MQGYILSFGYLVDSGAIVWSSLPGSISNTESKLGRDGSITAKNGLTKPEAEILLSLLRKCAWAPSKDGEIDANYNKFTSSI